MKLNSGLPGSLFKGLQKHCRAALLAVMLLLIAALVTSCVPVAKANETNPNNSITGAAPAAGSAIAYDENTLAALYEKSIPAVVMVQVTIDNQVIPNPFGFGTPQQRGQGSGFVIDSQGNILTNNHVVDNATKLKVVLHNGKSMNADIVGTDKENDLAIIKVDPANLSGITPLILGDSDALKPGQMAIALGSPYGLEGSITVGIISGTGRSMPSSTERPIANIIQTDAAINPGNSGGPLLNSKGEVIGINTAIEPLATGIGYCVPIDTAKSLLPALLKGGEVKNAWLGIAGVEIDEELATELNLAVKSGVYVVFVTSGGPAEKAGLKPAGENQQNEPTTGGDIIVAVDGKPVTKVEDMVMYFNTKLPGDKVTLSIHRNGESQAVDVTLGEWPE